MKIQATTTSFTNAPDEVLDAGWCKECIPDITPGKAYEVHAISIFGQPEIGWPRLLSFQIVGDSGVPTWLPSFLFDVVDRVLPADWEGNLFPSGNFVIGPPFVVESEEARRSIVELEPEAMQKFWSRKQQIESQAE